MEIQYHAQYQLLRTQETCCASVAWLLVGDLLFLFLNRHWTVSTVMLIWIRSRQVHGSLSQSLFRFLERLSWVCLPPPPSWMGTSSAFKLLVAIYAPGWREALWEISVLPRNTVQCPWPGLELETEGHRGNEMKWLKYYDVRINPPLSKL